MPATPEVGGSHLGGDGRRLALVIATGTYSDPALSKLRAPGSDAIDLAAVLEDTGIGEFEVETLLDASAEKLRRQVAHFCSQVSPGDLVLVYLSCHGVLDDRGRLYYASTDTDRSLLAATALPAAWLNEQLEDCRGRRQILVLDCCHSGAFAKGAKGESELALGERFEGRGRVVLTGSRGTEYSFEHDEVVGESSSSVFTGALIAGLRSGDADRDGDGVVSVGELYDYAYDAVRAKEARQTPTLWTYGAEGEIAVARSPRGPIVEPVPLPEDLVMLLESARPRVRESGVHELTELLNGDDAGRALTARAELERIAEQDVAGVAAAARAALEYGAALAGPSPPTPASPPPTPPPSAPADPPSPPPSRQRLWAVLAGAALLAVFAFLVVILASGGGGGNGDRTNSGAEASAQAKTGAVGAIPAASEAGPISVPGSPRGVTVADGATWVARYDDGVVTRIDNSARTKKSVPVGEHPTRIVADEGAVWVGIEDGERLLRLNPTTAKPTGDTIDLEVGCECPATALEIAGPTLWVSSAEAETMTPFDRDQGQRLHRPFDLSPGFEGAFVVGGETVWAVANEEGPPKRAVVIEIYPGLQPTRTPVGADPFLIAITSDEESVWVADSANGHNTINSFFEENGAFEEIAEVENGITGGDLAYSYEKKEIIVWDPLGGYLTAVPPSGVAGTVIPGRRVKGYEPNEEINLEASDFALDGEFAWVTEPSGDTLHKVRY